MIYEFMSYDFDAPAIVVDERLEEDAAYVIDSSRAYKKVVCYPRITLQEGLAEVITWVEDNWEEIKEAPLEYSHNP